MTGEIKVFMSQWQISKYSRSVGKHPQKEKFLAQLWLRDWGLPPMKALTLQINYANIGKSVKLANIQEPCYLFVYLHYCTFSCLKITSWFLWHFKSSRMNNANTKHTYITYHIQYMYNVQQENWLIFLIFPPNES